MALRFCAKAMRAVLDEAKANDCDVILAKDQSAYFLARDGAFGPDGRRTTLVYAQGCDPSKVDFDTWWTKVVGELGGDDFLLPFKHTDDVFKGLDAPNAKWLEVIAESDVTLILRVLSLRGN